MSGTMNNQYWNSLAQDYKDQVMEIADRDLRGVLKEEIALAAKGARLAADLGCGTGGLLGFLSPHFKSVHAVDYARDLLDQARQRHAELGNITYIHHNLAGDKPLSFEADVTFCINAMISPLYDHRWKMADCVRQTTKSGGISLFVVPSFESIFNTYHTLIRCQTREGGSRPQAVREMEHFYQKEILSPVDGIVDIGGTATKCFTAEELTGFLSDTGYRVERVRKIEFPWNEEMEDVPRWLKEPYPWDWLAVARKENA